MQIDLSNRAALVTGGGSGIGEATAVAFSQAGAKVMIVDIDGDAGERTAARILEQGGSAESVEVDVSDRGAVEAAVQRTVDVLGGIDFAFNNAGVGSPRRAVADVVDEELDELLRVNLKGVWNCLRAELPAMVAAGGGAIVNTSSATALQAIPGMSCYAVSKAAVLHLSQVAAAEYAGHGIRVNALCPGPIRTPMLDRMPRERLEQLAAGVPMGRLGSAEEIAQTVVWLCSDAAGYLTGVALPVDGGEQL